jgi:hypothetical protein
MCMNRNLADTELQSATEFLKAGALISAYSDLILGKL